MTAAALAFLAVPGFLVGLYTTDAAVVATGVALLRRGVPAVRWPAA
jgi:hypothetical protein